MHELISTRPSLVKVNETNETPPYIYTYIHTYIHHMTRPIPTYTYIYIYIHIYVYIYILFFLKRKYTHLSSLRQ